MAGPRLRPKQVRHFHHRPELDDQRHRIRLRRGSEKLSGDRFDNGDAIADQIHHRPVKGDDTERFEGRVEDGYGGHEIFCVGGWVVDENL